MSDRRARVFLAGPPPPGASAYLDPEESHHASRVLRLRAGDEVAVFDGEGGEWEAVVAEVAAARVGVLIGSPRGGSPEPPIRVGLVQALTRPEKLEWILQKGTEIGVVAFRLVRTDRVEAPTPSPSRLERYRRIVLEACKQSGRRRLPSVELGPWPEIEDGAVAFLLDPAEVAPPIGEAMRHARAPRVWIAAGPEGGLAPDEIAGRSEEGWRSVSLGPRVLRTETAGAVAAAIVLHAWGDLGATHFEPPI